MKTISLAVLAVLMMLAGGALAEDTDAGPVSPTFDEALASTVGADAYGMRYYVLVILKTGPTPMPASAERDAMFRGHFSNMKRLSEEGKLMLAGPLDGVDGWRGLFILAVTDLEEAAAIVATDPVVIQGEMIAEYHKYYGSAALLLVRDLHEKVARKRF
jgi:uncharacterized protein YciI